MKKLLSILATLAVTTSSASTVLAFDNKKQDKVEERVNSDGSVGANNDVEVNNTPENPKVDDSKKDDNDQLIGNKDEDIINDDQSVGNNESNSKGNENVDQTVKHYADPVVDYGSQKLLIRNNDGKIGDWNYGLIRIHNIFDGAEITNLTIKDNDESLNLVGNVNLTSGQTFEANNGKLYNVELDSSNQSKGYVDVKLSVNVDAAQEVIKENNDGNINKDYKHELGTISIEVGVKYAANKALGYEEEVKNVKNDNISVGLNYAHYKKQLVNNVDVEKGIASFKNPLGAVRVNDEILKGMNADEKPPVYEGEAEQTKVYIIDKATTNQALLKTAILRTFERDYKEMMAENNLTAEDLIIRQDVDLQSGRALVEIKRDAIEKKKLDIEGRTLFHFELEDINIENHFPSVDENGNEDQNFNPDQPTGNGKTHDDNDPNIDENHPGNPDGNDQGKEKGFTIAADALKGYDRLRMANTPDLLQQVLKEALFNTPSFKPFAKLANDPKFELKTSDTKLTDSEFEVSIKEGNLMNIKATDFKVKFAIQKAKLEDYITNKDLGQLKDGKGQALKYNAEVKLQKSLIEDNIYKQVNDETKKSEWLKGKVDLKLTQFEANEDKPSTFADETEKPGKQYDAVVSVKKDSSFEGTNYTPSELIENNDLGLKYKLESLGNAGDIINPPLDENGKNPNNPNGPKDENGNPQPDTPNKELPSGPGEDGNGGESDGSLPTVDPNNPTDPSNPNGNGEGATDHKQDDPSTPDIDETATFEAKYFESKESFLAKFDNYIQTRYKKLKGKIEIDKEAVYGDKDVAGFENGFEKLKGKNVYETINAWDPSTWNVVLKPTDSADGEITGKFAMHFNLIKSDITELIKTDNIGQIASKFYLAGKDDKSKEELIKDVTSEIAKQSAATKQYEGTPISEEFTPEVIEKLIDVKLGDKFDATDLSTWDFSVTPKKWISDELTGQKDTVKFKLAQVTVPELFGNDGVIDLETIQTHTLEDIEKAKEEIEKLILGKGNAGYYGNVTPLPELAKLLKFEINKAEGAWTLDKGSVLVDAKDEFKDYVIEKEVINFKRTRIDVKKIFEEDKELIAKAFSQINYLQADQKSLAAKLEEIIKNLLGGNKAFKIAGTTADDIRLLKLEVNNTDDVLTKEIVIKAENPKEAEEGNKFTSEFKFDVTLKAGDVDELIPDDQKPTESNPIKLQSWSVANKIAENKIARDDKGQYDWTKTSLNEQTSKEIANKLNDAIKAKKPDATISLTEKDIVISKIDFKDSMVKADDYRKANVTFKIADGKGFDTSKEITWAIEIAASKQSEVVKDSLLTTYAGNYATKPEDVKKEFIDRFTKEYGDFTGQLNIEDVFNVLYNPNPEADAPATFEEETNSIVKADVKVNDSYNTIINPEGQQFDVDRAKGDKPDLSKLLSGNYEVELEAETTVTGDMTLESTAMNTITGMEDFKEILAIDKDFFSKHTTVELSNADQNDRTHRTIIIKGVDGFYQGSITVNLKVAKAEIPDLLTTYITNKNISVGVWDILAPNREDILQTKIIGDVKKDIYDTKVGDPDGYEKLRESDININISTNVDKMEPESNGVKEMTIEYLISAKEGNKNFNGEIKGKAIVKSQDIQDIVDKNNLQIDLKKFPDIDSASTEEQIQNAIKEIFNGKDSEWGKLGPIIKAINWMSTSSNLSLSTTASGTETNNWEGMVTGVATLTPLISEIKFKNHADKYEGETSIFELKAGAENMVLLNVLEYLNEHKGMDLNEALKEMNMDPNLIKTTFIPTIYNQTVSKYESDNNSKLFTNTIGQEYRKAIDVDKTITEPTASSYKEGGIVIEFTTTPNGKHNNFGSEKIKFIATKGEDAFKVEIRINQNRFIDLIKKVNIFNRTNKK